MKKLITLLAYIAAFALLPLAFVAFVEMPSLTQLLVKGTGLQVSPWYTGGEIVRSIDHGSYLTRIHAPVFQALVGERSEGFVQIDWSKRDQVPALLEEEIDYDGDGKGDFRVQWNTRFGEPKLTAIDSRILGLETTYRLTERYAIRVKIRNAPSQRFAQSSPRTAP